MIEKKCPHCDTELQTVKSGVYGLIKVQEIETEIDKFIPVVVGLCENCGHIDLTASIKG